MKIDHVQRQETPFKHWENLFCLEVVKHYKLVKKNVESFSLKIFKIWPVVVLQNLLWLSQPEKEWDQILSRAPVNFNHSVTLGLDRS